MSMNPERLIKDGYWLQGGVWVKDCSRCGEIKPHGTKCRCEEKKK